MTLLLATHHQCERVQSLVANHPELTAVAKIVVSNKPPAREGVDVFSPDPLRKRRDIGMFYDAAMVCDDDLLLCLNDDVRLIALEFNPAHLAAQMRDLEVIFFQPNLASWACEADLDDGTHAGRAAKRQLAAHGRRVRFGRTHAFLCQRSWLLRAFDSGANARCPAQAFEKATLKNSLFAFAQPMHLIVDSNTLPFIQNSLPASQIATRWLPPCPGVVEQAKAADKSVKRGSCGNGKLSPAGKHPTRDGSADLARSQEASDVSTAPPREAVKVLFLNDCSRYHVGSALVTREFQRLCGRVGMEWTTDVQAAGLALLNGEGTMHHDRQSARLLLEQLRSLEDRMPAALLNTVWEGMSAPLEGLSLMATRESLSAEALRDQMPPGADVRVLPDISLCCRHRHEGGSERHNWLFVDSVCGKTRTWLKKAAAAWNSRYLELCQWQGSAEELIDLMAGYEAVISGRFHGVALALLADTPVLALPSNTHKTPGMMNDLGIGDSYCDTPEALDVALRERRFGRVTRTELDRIESDWRSTLAELRDLAQERQTHVRKIAGNRQPLSLPQVAEPMTMNTQDDTLVWNAVLWERDRARVMEALNGEAGDGLLLRARHRGGVLEVREPVSPKDFDEVLRQHGVDLSRPLDLEVRRAQRLEHGRPRPSLQAPPPATPTLGGAAATMSMSGGTVAAVRQEAAASPATGEGARAPVPTRLAPMFFRADHSTVDLADLYRGQTLFLVLNGASLQDFDFDRLKQPGICSMGVNNGAHGFRPQFWTCVDDPTRFLDSIWRDPAILKFVPQGHFDKPIWDPEKDRLSNWKVRDFPNVLGYRRNDRFQAAQWLHEDSFNWGNHADYGGGRSVMLVALRLACLLGFRKVHLLGCDFQMDAQHRYWFDEERTPASIRSNASSYRIMTGYFEQLKPHFDRAGFQVFNCNPESHLKVFPFADPDAALREAEVRRSASTRGMYVDRFKAPAVPGEECREFLEPLLAAINSAEVSTEPFVHLRLSGVFPEPVYRGLLAHLPDQHHYHELRHTDAIQPDGKSARLRFTFSEKELAALPPEQRAFWQRVLAALRDPLLEKAFRDKLKAGLHERFRDSLSEIILRPVPELIRDLTGYRIGAHTGIFKKVLSAQFYLPEDEQQEPLGTVFYHKDGSGKAHAAQRMPFLPATGYAFAVNARSWHGVDTVPAQPKPRNSLMLTYYLGKPA